MSIRKQGVPLSAASVQEVLFVLRQAPTDLTAYNLAIVDRIFSDFRAFLLEVFRLFNKLSLAL